MKLFRPLFSDKITGFYTVSLGLVLATLFLARVNPAWPFNTVSILLLVVAWIAEGNFRTKFSNAGNVLIWLPAALFLLYLAGMVYTENTAIGWRSVEQKLSLILAPLIVGTAASLRREHIAWGLFVFVCSAFFAAIVAFCMAVLNASAHEQIGWIEAITYEKLAGAIRFQPIYLSYYLVLAFYFLIALYAESAFAGQWFYQRKRRVFPLLTFFFITIIMLSSRMEILVLFATGAALIMLFLPSPAQRRKYLFTMGAMLLLAMVVILSSAENKQRFVEMFDFSSDYTENQYGGRSIRIHKWKNTLERWAESPILGVGTGDMQNELNKTYENNNFQMALHYEFNPHNQYFETLLTIGVPGFLVLIIWLWGLCVVGWFRQNWLLFAFGLIVAMSIITESMFERQWGIVSIAFFSVLLMRIPNVLNTKPSNIPLE